MSQFRDHSTRRDLCPGKLGFTIAFRSQLTGKSGSDAKEDSGSHQGANVVSKSSNKGAGDHEERSNVLVVRLDEASHRHWHTKGIFRPNRSTM